MVEHGGALGEALYWAVDARSSSASARTSSSLLMFVSGRPAAHRDDARRRSSARPAGRCVSAGTGTREVARTVRSAARPRPTDPWGDAPRRRDRDHRERETETLRDRARSRPRTTTRTRRSPSARATTRAGAADEPDASTPSPARRPSAEPEPRRAEPVGGRSGRTPMGSRRRRDGVTESEEVDYQLPPTKALEQGKADPGPDMRDREATAKRAARVAAPLRGRGAAARHRQRPAREPLRAPARARDQGLQGRPAQGRPRLRARLDRHPHPRADPGQEGGRASRSRTSAGASSASATSTASRRRAPRRCSAGSARTSPARP